MTKVSVLGEEPKEKELKKIELFHCLQNKGDGMYPVISSSIDLREYYEVILISKNYTEGVDVILAKHERYGDCLFTGKWND